MSPARIRKRTTKKGLRYQVVYRRGGRGFQVESAGTFRTEREAKLRRDLVAGWLATAKDPRVELAALLTPPVPSRTYAQWAEAYKASRIDIDEETRKNLGSHLGRLLPIFEERVPGTLTIADQIEAVATLAAELKPSSVRRYWATHRLILDFAGVDPNTARDSAVKLPTVIELEPDPPTAAHLLALLDKTPFRWRLPLVTLEQTAMAVGELHTLAWGDVDVDGCQFRLRRSEVKARIRARARWVQVPKWLMLLIEETCPLEDRTPQRRVFLGFSPDVAKNAMARACKTAKVPHFSPHDLRHRRISLWHGQGIPAKQLAERAGHSRASMSLDRYSHVMPLDEASTDALSDLLVRPQ